MLFEMPNGVREALKHGVLVALFMFYDSAGALVTSRPANTVIGRHHRHKCVLLTLMVPLLSAAINNSID